MAMLSPIADSSAIFGSAITSSRPTPTSATRRTVPNASTSPVNMLGRKALLRFRGLRGGQPVATQAADHEITRRDADAVDPEDQHGGKLADDNHEEGNHDELDKMAEMPPAAQHLLRYM